MKSILVVLLAVLGVGGFLARSWLSAQTEVEDPGVLGTLEGVSLVSASTPSPSQVAATTDASTGAGSTAEVASTKVVESDPAGKEVAETAAGETASGETASAEGTETIASADSESAVETASDLVTTNTSGGSAPGSGHGSGHNVASKHLELVPKDSKFVSFEDLASFWYEPPDTKEVLKNPELKRDDQFPAAIRAQDGKKVTIEGYVTPISIQKGRVTSFILGRYVANCCWGVMPEVNEWVDVTMPEGEGLEFIPYGTVLVTGSFEVGEIFDEYGYVRSVYRMKAESVLEPDA